ncbi:MAG: winged helix-turn-helix transcriptional regulator [Candidatus Levybacteria bacterium]|nr:winged helix-turn-helix transcriptional regulator [Candidatus Levybacteria bacterium]
MLSDLITSRSRVKLLNVFLSNPSEMYHVRELVRRTGDEINAVRRELSYLEKKGILTKEPRANRVYYFLSKNYEFYFDLLKIGSKTVGLGENILKNRVKLGRLKYVMFSGKFARRLPKGPEDVDLLVVGAVVLPELALLVREEEKRLDTEINYTVMTEEEFDFRKKKRDPFILSILYDSRVMLIGDEENMLS